MAFLKTAFDILTAGERTIKSPIFVKDFSKDNKQLRDLSELSSKLKNGYKKELVERDLAFLKKGIAGENNVYFELKNSFLPILCLHDIRLKYGDYVAQFDFIVISNKFICILETKQLNGNIVISPDGDFIRIITNKHGKEIKREGIYSPITQNQRHLNILKEVLYKEGIVRTMPYLSLVVIANSKSIINKTRCPENIKKSIYKFDQIIPFLTKHQDDKSNEKNLLEKYMWNIANFLVDNDTQASYDYYSKYRLTDDDFLRTENTVSNLAGSDINNKLEVGTINEKKYNQLYEELKKYRLVVSRKENIPAYMVFNNEELERLISRFPTCEQELLEVKGFGKKKVEEIRKRYYKNLF